MRYPSLLSLTIALLLTGAAQSLRAEEHVVYYAQPTGDSDNFFHRVGQFFHDLFPAEQNLSPRPTPPQPTAPRYNLDLPPPGTGYSYRPSTAHHRVSAEEQKSVNSTEQTKTATHTAVSNSPVPKHTVSSTEAAEHKDPVKPTKKSKASGSSVESGSETVVSSTTTTTKSSSSPKVTTTETTTILTGTRTSKTARVKSPYPPYNELDVSGLPSGSLAQDPTTQKIFRVP